VQAADGPGVYKVIGSVTAGSIPSFKVESERERERAREREERERIESREETRGGVRESARRRENRREGNRRGVGVHWSSFSSPLFFGIIYCLFLFISNGIYFLFLFLLYCYFITLG
jgi:hypothetical protein